MNTFVPVATIDALRERIRCLEGRARHQRPVLPFGIKAIDERLPEGGLALGALHEVAGGGNGAVDGAAAALFIVNQGRLRLRFSPASTTAAVR
jgi:protein ImuA